MAHPASEIDDLDLRTKWGGGSRLLPNAAIVIRSLSKAKRVREGVGGIASPKSDDTQRLRHSIASADK